MWIWLFNFIFHNMLFRELLIVALMVWAIVRFYHDYMRAASSNSDRVRRFGTRNIVMFTRKLLLTLVCLLVLVIAYDRILPHWGIGASQELTAMKAERAAQKTDSRGNAEQTAKHTSSSKKVADRSHKRAATAKSTSVAKANRAKAQSHSRKVVSKAKRTKQADSSSVDLKRGTKRSAVTIVEKYFKRHPHEKSNDIDTFKYAGKTTAYNRVAYQVGGYAHGQAKMIHLFYVYGDGQIATVY